ncbi:MAG: hypothetical protein ACE5I1_06855 [bacterium]
MLKLTFIIIAGAGLSIFSAFFGLSRNENFHTENLKVTKASVDFLNSEENLKKDEMSTQLSLLSEKEKDAVATLQISNQDFSPIDLYVTDTEDLRVRTLIRKHLSAGTYQISWYGETDLTTPLIPGLYIITLDSNDSRQMLKVVLEN